MKCHQNMQGQTPFLYDTDVLKDNSAGVMLHLPW